MLSNLFEKILSKNFFVLLIIAALVILVFGKSISFGYVGLDEAAIINDRLEYLSNPLNAIDAFFHSFNYPAPRIFPFYRPIFTISFIPGTILGGGEIWVYNTTNTLIHILASFSLFLLLVKLKTRKEIAFFMALLFSVHPLVTASVEWIPGRNDSLLGIFSILTFLFFIYFFEKSKRIYLFFHILFFTLALFTKENAVALIPICYYFYYISKDKKESILLKLPIILWSVVLIIWFVLRYIALSEVEAAGIPFESFITNFPGVFIYIYKLILPYQMTVIPTLDQLSILLGLATSGIILVLWFYSKESRKKLNIGLMWILFFLLSGLLSYEVPQRMAFFEHRGYVVLIGFMIFISQLGFINNEKYKKIIYSSFILLILVYSFISFNYSNNYRNQLSFWSKAIKDTPELARSHKGIGLAYFNDNRNEEAEREYKKAIEIYPEEPRTHKYLGDLYSQEGRDLEALNAYFTELKISKDESNLIYKIARIYAKNGNFLEAEKYFLMMLDIDPDHILSHQDLAVLYFERGDYEKSESHIQELLKRNVKLHPEIIKIQKIYKDNGIISK